MKYFWEILIVSISTVIILSIFFMTNPREEILKTREYADTISHAVESGYGVEEFDMNPTHSSCTQNMRALVSALKEQLRINKELSDKIEKLEKK